VNRHLLSDGFGFVEGPRWRAGFLWVSDIAARAVLCLDEAGNVVTRLTTPGRPSGLGWLPDGRLLVVSMDERAVLRYEDDVWEVHADLSRFTAAPLNDMVVSASGRAYVTGLGYDAGAEEPRPTEIVLVLPDGRAAAQPHPVWRPNGCVITPDGARFIVAETRLHRLTEFRIAADGTLCEPEIVAVLPRGTWADGICLDTEGCIWVADPKGRACRRVTRSGEILAEIDTSPLPCIACTLGGRDGRALFLLLSELGDFDELARRKQARIETVNVDVAGAGSP
jgi:sugar lactone lactonase YvrE